MSECNVLRRLLRMKRKRKKYATDSEMNKSPKSPRLRSQAVITHRDVATKTASDN